MKARSLVLNLLLILVTAGSSLGQTAVTLAGVTNTNSDSVLAGGSTHTLTLNYNLTGAPDGRGYLIANAWKFYSPDGANWEYVQATTSQAFLDIGWDYPIVSHFNKTGGTGKFGLPLAIGGGNASGNDTVAVLLAGINAQPGGGLPSGFNSLLLNIEFKSRSEDIGLHICFDTTQQVPGGAWEWAHADGLIQPDWTGRQCWVISCCNGRVGDANGVGGDEPTIGDISVLIDFLFISNTQPNCLEESDVNLSGTLLSPPPDWNDVTIGDVSSLINYVFITHETLLDCP